MVSDEIDIWDDKLWEQAAGELRGFANSLAKKKMTITAAQIRMALDRASVAVRPAPAPPGGVQQAAEARCQLRAVLTDAVKAVDMRECPGVASDSTLHKGWTDALALRCVDEELTRYAGNQALQAQKLVERLRAQVRDHNCGGHRVHVEGDEWVEARRAAGMIVSLRTTIAMLESQLDTERAKVRAAKKLASGKPKPPHAKAGRKKVITKDGVKWARGVKRAKPAAKKRGAKR